MHRPMALDLPPPRDWQAFEDLCLDLWRRIWADPDAQKHGRQGHPQAGVDVFGRRATGGWEGVQCKQKGPQARLTAAEIETELAKAQSFRPGLTRFILATTAPRDPAIQEFVRDLKDRADLPFPVAVFAWDDILDELQAHPDLIRRYYAGPVPSPEAVGKTPPVAAQLSSSGAIQNFFIHYQGTPSSPVAFGGRQSTLEALDAWFDNSEEAPYLLLAAPAGRGKSAVLVRWSERLAGRTGVTTVFVPISVRFNTNLSRVVFSSLVSQLAAAHGDAAPLEPDAPAGVWQSLFSSYLRRQPPAKLSLVVILDGLDEAADFVPGPSLFPLDPPAGLRIVVSARYLTGDDAAGGWLRRLGWDRPGLARSVDLPPLNRNGLIDVLAGAGVPIGELDHGDQMAAELHRLSEGEPLLVQMYAQDLEATSDAATAMTLERLAGLEPGIDHYIQRWWSEQQALWQDQAPLLSPVVQTVLKLLANALGPLRRDDFLALAAEELDGSSLSLQEAMRPLARFVVGDGSTHGYVFGHPRLAVTFEGGLSATEREAVQARFLVWGAESLDALEAGRLSPQEMPAYLVAYHGTHLQRANRGPKAFSRLVTDSWRRAWEAHSGTYSGFLSDVDRAWRAAEGRNRKSLESDQLAPTLGLELRCALCTASVASLSSQLPVELIELLVQEGLWSTAQGRAFASMNPDSGVCSRVVARLSVLSDSPEREELQREAFDAARGVESLPDQAEVLAEIAPCLEGPVAEAFHRHALSLLGKIDVEFLSFPKAFRLLAPVVPAEPFLALLEDTLGRGFGEVLAVAAPNLTVAQLERVLDPEGPLEQRCSLPATAELAGYLPEQSRTDVLSRVMQCLRGIRDEGDRKTMLSNLAPHLDGPSLNRALSLAEEFASDQWRADWLTCLAPHLDADQLRRSLDSARQIDGLWRSKAIEGLAPYLPEHQLDEVLEIVRGEEEDVHASRTIRGLAPFLRGHQLDEVLVIVRGLSEKSKALALSRVSYHLGPEHVTAAREIARDVEEQSMRNLALSGLTPHLDVAEREEALQAVTSGWLDKRAKVAALTGLAAHLDEPLRIKALKEAAFLVSRVEPYQRLEFLDEFVPHLDQISLHDLVTKIAFGDANRRSALCTLAPHLGASAAADALAIARSIGDAAERSRALTALAPRAAETDRRAVLQEALAATRLIADYREHAGALAALADLTGEARRHSVLRQALAAARATENELGLSEVLTLLAPRLNGDLLQEALAMCSCRRATDHSLLGLGKYIDALAALLPRLPMPARESLVDEALGALGEARSSMGLERLVEHLSPTQRQKALRLAWDEAGEGRVENCAVRNSKPLRTLLALADSLEASGPLGFFSKRRIEREREHMVERAVQAVLSLGRGVSRQEGLLTVWPHTSGRLRARVQEAALKEAAEPVNQFGSMNRLYFRRIAPHLDTRGRARAMELVCDPSWRVSSPDIVAELAIHAASDRRSPFLERALATALRSPSSNYSAAIALVELAPHLSAGQIRRAHAAIEKMPSWEAGLALSAIVPYLAPQHRALALHRAVSCLDAITTPEKRIRALRHLAPYLVEGQHTSAALAAARSLDQADDRFGAFTALLEHDGEPFRSEVLAEAVRAAFEAHPEAWSALTDSLMKMDRVRLHSYWCAGLRSLATRKRSDLLRHIAALSSVLLLLGGRQAVDETTAAISDVADWWP